MVLACTIVIVLQKEKEMSCVKSKELRQMGLPSVRPWFPMAMKALNVAIAKGNDKDLVCHTARKLIRNPDLFDAECPGELKPYFEPLIEGFRFCKASRITYIERENPAPWQRWGEMPLEGMSIGQMEDACNLPISVGGALMPDAHTGYGLPIGGILAVRNAVIPFAVGVDIACRMRLTVLDLPVEKLEKHEERFISAIENETGFGIGAAFEKGQRRRHGVMDEDWNISPVTSRLKGKAAQQLGSSGSGNHFVEFGVLELQAPARENGFTLEPGRYLALLSHSGSRGTGEAVARYYSELARDLHPEIPEKLAQLAWLELTSSEGQEYWNAMQLMGRYASANHELIHKHVLGALGAEPLAMVENHHNFAWKEMIDGEELIIHRKGATPANEGRLGVVPGSMCSNAFVVRGKGNPASYFSCSHGAGRKMSRAAAYRELTREKLDELLAKNNVHLLSGTLDESPEAYKDINEVMAAQADLVDVLARFEPRLVKMAPEAGSRLPKWKIEKDRKKLKKLLAEAENCG